MLQMLNACLTTQALSTVATLGLADLLDEPKTADELAAATGTHAPSLYRLLRMLTGVDVFQEKSDGRFALTPLGETLRRDVPSSVRDWAIYVGAHDPWEAWGRLRDAVTTGETGFEHAHGMPTYAFLSQHPDLGGVFDRWMTQQSNTHNEAIVAAYDFSAIRVLADVGGGQGSTLAAILRATPSLRGILFDVPQVVAETPALHTDPLANRCAIVSGDMLKQVPVGADAYLMKRVLMIWGDDAAVQVLRHCAAALPENGKVLVIEMVMPTGNDPSPAKSFDLLMLLANEGGRVRTEAEFRALFAAAGLRLMRVIPTASPNSILEAVVA